MAQRKIKKLELEQKYGFKLSDAVKLHEFLTYNVRKRRELREKVIEMRKQGKKFREIARELKKPMNRVKYIWRKHRKDIEMRSKLVRITLFHLGTGNYHFRYLPKELYIKILNQFSKKIS